MGRARSGKDTVAARLMDHGYKRLAFADPLKAMVRDMDPYVITSPGVAVRLNTLVGDVGWEYAKDKYPEVRALLQRTGQAVRDRDPYFWVRLLMAQVEGARDVGYPIVVSDVRYPNEADTLAAHGFTLVRVQRDRWEAETVTPDELTNRRHTSEQALAGYAPDRTMRNLGSLTALRRQADTLISP
ncbi:hypothetical protein FFZ77_25835 [Streptomyces katsurahamanus]|uniref:ATP-binding protein n=2 Tax=Streptomyces katsurahamanus TaxID=2577098 RepID=A0ABW9NZX6_9ACTN|nr:hypothetical protein [Streptomyces katsurahamanus]